MVTVEFVALFLGAIAHVDGTKLPSYILPCSLSDPNLNECGRKHGQDALSFIVKGDSKYRIPSMIPLKIPEIKFNTGNLNIQLFKAEIFGLEDTQIEHVKLDLPNKHISITVIIERANLLCDYKIDGRLVILPIRGEGHGNITFVGGEYNYQFDYDFKEKRGAQYLEIANNTLDYSTRRSHFIFENLFGGDRVLGIQTNQFLDENWKEVQEDIGPALAQTINMIITTTITGIVAKVPFDELFLP